MNSTSSNKKCSALKKRSLCSPWTTWGMNSELMELNLHTHYIIIIVYYVLLQSTAEKVQEVREVTRIERIGKIIACFLICLNFQGSFVYTVCMLLCVCVCVCDLFMLGWVGVGADIWHRLFRLLGRNTCSAWVINLCNFEKQSWYKTTKMGLINYMDYMCEQNVKKNVSVNNCKYVSCAL